MDRRNSTIGEGRPGDGEISSRSPKFPNAMGYLENSEIKSWLLDNVFPPGLWLCHQNCHLEKQQGIFWLQQILHEIYQETVDRSECLTRYQSIWRQKPIQVAPPPVPTALKV